MASSVPSLARMFLRNEAAVFLSNSEVSLKASKASLSSYLGPDVAVVAGRVAADDVGEIGGAAAGQDLGDQADAVHDLFSKLVTLTFSGALQRVPGHVQEAGRPGYSTVSKPWLNRLLFLIFSTSAAGMTSPVW